MPVRVTGRTPREWAELAAEVAGVEVDPGEDTQALIARIEAAREAEAEMLAEAWRLSRGS